MISRPLILSLVLATAFSPAVVIPGCLALRAKGREFADQAAGGAVAGAVRTQDPGLAKDIEDDAARRKDAGEETPWLNAIRDRWVEILATLLLGGGSLAGLGKLWRDKARRGELLEVLSGAIGAVTENGGGEEVRAAIRKEAAAVGIVGSVRRNMEKAGIRINR